MRREHLEERQEKLLHLAGRAHNLLGRILDARTEHLGGQPQPVGTPGYTEDNPRTQVYNGQIERARYLSGLATMKANTLPDTRKLKRVPKPKPAPEKSIRRFRAKTRSDEAMSEYTTSTIEKMTADLDDIHDSYSPGKSEKARKREFISGETTLHASTGGEKIEKTVRNRFIVVQDDVTQTVLWLAQAGGPRYAPYLQLPADRVSFTLKKINLGRPENNHMDGETLWGHVEKAAEEGLLTDPMDPKITVEGLGHIQERLAQDRALVQDRPLAHA